MYAVTAEFRGRKEQTQIQQAVVLLKATFTPASETCVQAAASSEQSVNTSMCGIFRAPTSKTLTFTRHYASF